MASVRCSVIFVNVNESENESENEKDSNSFTRMKTRTKKVQKNEKWMETIKIAAKLNKN